MLHITSMFEQLYVWASLVPLQCKPPFPYSKIGFKDCYISHAQSVMPGLARGRHPILWGLAGACQCYHLRWLSINSKELDYYCNLNNFVSPKVELCRKALVNISVELYIYIYIYMYIYIYIYMYIVSDYRINYAHNDLIGDFRIFGIQIGIFQTWSSNLLHLKLLASSESIIFDFSILVLNMYHIRSIYMYEDFRCRFYSALSQWPAMGGCYITTHWYHARVLPWGISPHTAYNQTKTKSQITITETVVLARNCNYSAKQWNPKPVLHIT